MAPYTIIVELYEVTRLAVVLLERNSRPDESAFRLSPQARTRVMTVVSVLKPLYILVFNRYFKFTGFIDDILSQCAEWVELPSVNIRRVLLITAIIIEARVKFLIGGTVDRLKFLALSIVCLKFLVSHQIRSAL